jgi:hypothetical protein
VEVAENARQLVWRGEDPGHPVARPGLAEGVGPLGSPVEAVEGAVAMADVGAGRSEEVEIRLEVPDGGDLLDGRRQEVPLRGIDLAAESIGQRVKDGGHTNDNKGDVMTSGLAQKTTSTTIQNVRFRPPLLVDVRESGVVITLNLNM